MIPHQPHKPDDDDLVDRATAALRDAATPPGPTDELLAKTLAAIESAQAADNHHDPIPITSSPRRIFTMKFAAKLAVAACLVIAVGALIFTGGPWGGQPAFADVLQKVQKVQSVRLKSVATVNIPNAPPNTPRKIEMTLLMTGDRMRQDVAGMFTNIFDFETGQSLALIAPQKKAIRMKLQNLPKNVKDQNVLEQFRNLKPDQGKSIGQKDIDGRTADGYNVVDGGQNMTVWADRQTRLPVRMEVSVNIPSIPASDVVMYDFEWDVPVDPAQLSLDVPAGYDVQEMTFDVAAPGEKGLVDALRAAVDLGGGTFPDTLDIAGVAASAKRAATTRPAGNLKDLTARIGQANANLMRGLMFLTPANGSDFRYAGKGAKLNDPDRPVFWYRPAKSDTYHVIYADLTVKTDVPATSLPNLESQELAPRTPPTPASQPASHPPTR